MELSDVEKSVFFDKLKKVPLHFEEYYKHKFLYKTMLMSGDIVRVVFTVEDCYREHFARVENFFSIANEEDAVVTYQSGEYIVEVTV